MIDDLIREPVSLVAFFAIYTVLGIGPLVIGLYGVYLVLTLPMRRAERASLVLDIVEMGIKEGRTPEQAIVQASKSRDPVLGGDFYALANELATGVGLSQGLSLVPTLLPLQITGMLKTGERGGDLRKVLPACRNVLTDAVSHVRGALNYLLLLSFVLVPLSVVIPLVVQVKVLPAFKQVYEGLTEGGALPGFTKFVFEQSAWGLATQLAAVVLFWTLLIGYITQGRAWLWLQSRLPVIGNLRDRVAWRRKRLQRDFSAMLAVLLDSGMPEPDALVMAADATGSRLMRIRAQRSRQMLQKGMKLPDAIQAMDDAGELGWRLSNALKRERGFMDALRGWHEALNAKAFQLEQGAAQIVTTAFVVINGAWVACVVIAMFLLIIRLMEQAVLW